MVKVIFLGLLDPSKRTGMLLGICDAQLPSYEAEHRGIAKKVTIPRRKPEMSITRQEECRAVAATSPTSLLSSVVLAVKRQGQTVNRSSKVSD
jgi:hypothetical protein